METINSYPATTRRVHDIILHISKPGRLYNVIQLRMFMYCYNMRIQIFHNNNNNNNITYKLLHGVFEKRARPRLRPPSAAATKRTSNKNIITFILCMFTAYLMLLWKIEGTAFIILYCTIGIASTGSLGWVTRISVTSSTLQSYRSQHI